MSFPPRLVSILALVQLFFVVGGTLMTRVHVNTYAKIVADVPDGFEVHSLSLVSRLVNSVGLWFVLVPAIWFATEVVRHRDRSDPSSLTVNQFWTGVGITSGVMLLFSYSAMSAFGACWDPVST